MDEPLYRVKFYGHTTGDDEKFCRNLAAVLKMDVDKARRLLERAPVPITREIAKSKAERLRDLIEAIKGLCLLEPVDAEAAKQDVVESAERILRQTLRGAPKSERAPEATRTTTLVVGTLGAISVAVALFLLAAVTRETPTSGPPEIPSRQMPEIPRGPEQAPAPTVPVEELQHDVGLLEATLVTQRSELQARQRELRSLHEFSHSPVEAIQDKQEEIVKLRVEIHTNMDKLRNLKYQLRRAQAAQGAGEWIELPEGKAPAQQDSDYGERH